MTYKTVYLHRLVAEQTVDRKLRPGEVVHHLDEDKYNNSPENMVIYLLQCFCSQTLSCPFSETKT